MMIKDFKILLFYKFAKSIGAIKTDSIEDLEIEDLLIETFLFLNQDRVILKKEELDFNIFKDRYNSFVDYCIDKSYIQKNTHPKVKNLNIIVVPDMSKIKVPDISKELKEMNIDLSNLGNIFGNLYKK